MKFLMIFIGGGLGSMLRYFIGSFLMEYNSTTFPWHTFLVNIIGSFLLGIFISQFEKSDMLFSSLALLTTVGFCGGFTTFSAFSIESYFLIKSGAIFQFALYLISSILGGIGAAILGYMLIK